MRYITRVHRHHTLVTGHRYDTKVLGCNKWTLFQAAKCGDIRQFENCINDKVDIGSKSKEGRTALHIAVANRQHKFAKYLLEQCPYCISKGADLDIQGLNALHICVVNGDAEIYSLLKRAGFDTGITTKDGKTASELAKENHHTHLLALMDVKQDIEFKDIPEGVTFNTGNIGQHLPSSQVLKFGAFTPELRCISSGTGHEEKIEYPQGKVLMRGLSRILCRVKHEKGDSGAGVFVKNTEGKLECVGLFFAGKGREGYFIPIQDVLRKLGNYDLKTYV